MARRVPSWLPLVVVVCLIVQSALPALPAPVLPVAWAAEAAPWPTPTALADPHPPAPARAPAVHATFLPLLLVAPSVAPEVTADRPPAAAPASSAAATQDLRLTFSAAPCWAEPGEVVTFTVTAMNPRRTALAGLTLTTTLPAGLVYVAQSAVGFTYAADVRTLTWPVGDLVASAVLTGSFQARGQGLALGATIT